MADFLICPRCRRQNPADAIFCNRCGVRLLSSGVYYRNRDPSSGTRMSQLVLGVGVLILAGLVLGGGAVIFLGGQRPTPSRVAGLPTDTALPTFVQPTATATGSPTFVLPTLIPTGPIITPTPFGTPPPTAQPTAPLPTAPPTPSPTPVDCAVASTGTDVKTVVMGYGNQSSRTLGKTWCIRRVTIHPVFNPSIPAQGYGTARLMRGDTVLAEWTCTTETCGDGVTDYTPPRRVRTGATLTYSFTCMDSPDNLLVDECADGVDDGMTISIEYEAFTP